MPHSTTPTPPSSVSPAGENTVNPTQGGELEKLALIKTDPRFDAVEGKLKQVTDTANVLKKISDENQLRLDKFEDKLITDKASLITVFGVFASIVTFLSVEVQILNSVCDPWRLVGFSLIVLTSLLSFIFVLHWIADSWINEKRKPIPAYLMVFVSVLFGIGGVCFFLGDSELSCRENTVFERYSTDFDQRQAELEGKIKESEKKVEDKLQEMKSKI